MKSKPTRSERIAEKITTTVGSFPFVIIQSCILLSWVILNSVGWFYHWDVYPFILMNLLLSLQAAYTGPFVLIAENRQTERERVTIEHDADTNSRALAEIREIKQMLTKIASEQQGSEE